MSRALMIAVLAALLASCASKPSQVRDDYVLDGISEVQFNRDYADCMGRPITDSDVTASVLLGPLYLVPDTRASVCMQVKGYKMVSAHERQTTDN